MSEIQTQNNDNDNDKKVFNYEFDFDLDECNTPIMINYIKSFIEEYGENDLLFIEDENKNKNENLIDRLTSKFQFLEKHKPKYCSCELDNVKNNFFAYLFNIIRETAKNNNIEKEFSKHITNLKIMPIHSILLKHSIDYYDYIDKIEFLNKIHFDFDFLDQKMYYLLNPKIILQTFCNLYNLRTLWMSYYLVMCSEKKYKKKQLLDFLGKVNNYLDTFESFFSIEFRKDYIDLCSNLQKEINYKKKHRPNKNQRKKLKKM
jgi:hypothetical protein